MRQVPTWDNYFMNIARTVASRSKDPATVVGCVIVGADNHILSTGYNGFTPGTKETPEMWERPTKYQHVIHAEANAITHATVPLHHHYTKMYCTMYPCIDCAKLIISSRINELYVSDLTYYSKQTEEFLARGGVTIYKLKVPFKIIKGDVAC